MPSWTVFGFFFISWILGIVIGGMMETTYIGEEEVSALSTLMSLDVMVWKTAFGLIPYPWFNTEWLGALLGAMTWDYAVFSSSAGQLIRFLFWGLSGGMMVVVLVRLMGLIRGSG